VGANVLATPHFVNQGILSASIAALAVGTPHLANQAILSAKIGAATVGTPHLANQAIVSALLGAGVVADAHIAALGVGTASLANTAVTSAKIGTGAVGGPLLQDGGILSGKIAADSIAEACLASGISIDLSEITRDPSYRAGAPLVSGALAVEAYEAVVFTGSGIFGQAQAGNPNRMPAIGVTPAGVASGAVGAFHMLGRITNTGWVFSGYEGSRVFVGTSSQITRTAPSASGVIVQRMGQIVGDKTVIIAVDPYTVQIGQ